MRLLPNANDIARKALKQDNTYAVYKSLTDMINHNYKHMFSTSFQMYVTKIGLALSNCSADIKMQNHTYLGSLDFICKKVIKNPPLYNVMRAIGMNDAGNTMKHDNRDLTHIDIEFVLKQYNEMISQLVKTTNLDAFKMCYLNKGKNQRDVPLIKEEKHHKYFTINNFQLQLKICPTYTVDNYQKILKSKLTLYWPKGRDNCYADVTVKNKKTGKVMGTVEKLNLSKDDSKHVFPLHCKENDLDRRVVTLAVTITLYRQTKEYYTTGALFWKSYHSYDSFSKIEEKTEVISQLFRPNA